MIDIVKDDLLVEIQTGNFASIKSKLMTLVKTHRTRLVFPIPQEKWIIKHAQSDGSEVTRRKSPKRGRIEDLFWEMVSFPQLLMDRNFSLEVLLTREEEVRRYDGKRQWRRKGWVIEERRLLAVVARRLFEEPEDWNTLLPEGLNLFTSENLAEAIGVRRRLAQKMAYCLRMAKVIELKGKRGRSNLYRRIAA